MQCKVTAGRWLAVDRGATEAAKSAPVIETEPQKFPLAERINDAELQAVFLFRENLPKLS